MLNSSVAKPCLGGIVTMRPCKPQITRRGDLQLVRFDPKVEKNMLGSDWGARDATAGELASDFSNKTQGNYDTDHLTTAPDDIGKFVGLGSKSCVPLEDGCAMLSETDQERLRQQVPGWRILQTGDCLSIRQDFKCQDADKAAELKTRIETVAEEEGHPIQVKTVSSEVFAVSTSPQAGGVTENDFILAAKINLLDLTDVLQKRRVRYWA